MDGVSEVHYALGFRVASRFTHRGFQIFSIADVPLNRDVFLMDEKWIPQWEKSYLALFSGKKFRNVGYISYAAVRQATPDALEVSWYPNIFDRFHEVSIVLPRSAFVTCVDVHDYDSKPHIFVKSDWLSGLHLRPYSAFALVDAIGVKKALMAGQLVGKKLLKLRDRIDEIAESNPGVAFVSFADSLLLKANWFVGKYDSDVSYSYEPEQIVRLIPRVAEAYRDVLSMEVYAVLAQGVNEYADPALLHRSPSGRHLSLNSLGLPFAQLLAIDDAARNAIRTGLHPPCQLYVDDHFYHSIRFIHGFDKHTQPSASYQLPMSTSPGTYYCTSVGTILDNLSPERSRFTKKRK